MLFSFANRPNYFCYAHHTILNSLWNIFYKIYAIEKYLRFISMASYSHGPAMARNSAINGERLTA